MSQPVTKLDKRFSDPDAVATEWEETRRELEKAELFWISTTREDGRPHVTPLVAVWLEDAIYFATGPDEQKAVNLKVNANVILTTGCNQWEHGLDVVVEGEAVQVTDDDLLERLAEAWKTKWDGQWQYKVNDGCFEHEGGGSALVFSVAPTKVFAFAKGTFGQTRHRSKRRGDSAQAPPRRRCSAARAEGNPFLPASWITRNMGKPGRCYPA